MKIFEENQSVSTTPRLIAGWLVHWNPESNCTCREKRQFPIPLKCIDVTWSAHTDLDVMQEKRVHDYWNVDSNRNLSDSWKGFTRFTLLKERPHQRIYPGEIDKNSNDYQTRSCMARSMDEIGEAAQNREKQEWAKEKPKFETARRLRGMYAIDPDDRDYKETLKHERRKLERPLAPVMPCKRKAPNGMTKVFAQSETASEKTPKTSYSCNVESPESTRQRVESSQPKKT